MAEANHSMKLLINERNPLRCHRHLKQGLDPKEIANSFCKYFANIGPKLAGEIPHQNVSFCTFLNSHYNGSMFLYPTNKSALQDICYSIKTDKAPGYDNVSMYVIEKSFDLINQSLYMEIFPEN